MSAAGLPVVAAARQRAAHYGPICITLLRSPAPDLYHL